MDRTRRPADRIDPTDQARAAGRCPARPRIDLIPAED
ncbi:hypothetical protein SAMN05444417_2826 [Wenxinia saemankumensis]|uniref:Uncharacterized protein n=1 Tax=Wenxinia saemankumensis TaxID=1447782 RepID=A0A1M6GNF0_9RHOB|nr:hypothetical protein SAMN05444417_2826 [Wenxinia saemankumensis]